MPHSIDVDGSRTTVRGVVELGRNGGRPLLRFQPFANGNLIVLAPAGARVDGLPMVGGVAIVEHGAGAVVRARGLRVEVRWERVREIRSASGGARCAICVGAIAARETVVACHCEATAHEGCFAVMVSCPSCGEAA